MANTHRLLDQRRSGGRAWFDPIHRLAAVGSDCGAPDRREQVTGFKLLRRSIVGLMDAACINES